MGPLLDGSNRRELRAGRILDGLTSWVPVQVPLEEVVARVVQFGALLSSGDRSAVVATSDFDVESLRPELAVAYVTVVVDRDDLSPDDVVSAGDARGDGDTLRVAVVVEDSIRTPVASLALSWTRRVAALAVVDERALVDFEEVQFVLVDVLAVAVAGSEVGGCPAMVGAVPALLVGAAATLVVPVKGYVRAGWCFGGVRRGRGVSVGNDVGAGVLLVHVRQSYTTGWCRRAGSACRRRRAGNPSPDSSTKQATCCRDLAWKPGGTLRRSGLPPRTPRQRCGRPRWR